MLIPSFNNHWMFHHFFACFHNVFKIFIVFFFSFLHRKGIHSVWLWCHLWWKDPLSLARLSRQKSSQDRASYNSNLMYKNILKNYINFLLNYSSLSLMAKILPRSGISKPHTCPSKRFIKKKSVENINKGQKKFSGNHVHWQEILYIDY